MFTRLFIIALVAGMTAAADPHSARAGGELMGDAARGEDIYGRCIACHALARNRTGPKHCDIFGRTAGTVDGFRFSKAMKDSGIVWTEETLDAFIENPRGTVPGTKMGYAGVKDAQERADLIAYLKRENEPGGECS